MRNSEGIFYCGRLGRPTVRQATASLIQRGLLEHRRGGGTYVRSVPAQVDLFSLTGTLMSFAENLTKHFGGAQIYIKREDLNHTGAHKANNVMGQVLLVERMSKRRVIAETGAGQHGVATATMAAKFGFDCTIYMGEVDVARQRPNVFWMERPGATVVPVRAKAAARSKTRSTRRFATGSA